MRRVSFMSLFIVTLLSSFLSCSDDDVSTSEYINPMKNNSVNEIGWLIERKNSLKEGIDYTINVAKETSQPITATIRMYKLDDANYYQIYYSIFPQGDYASNSIYDEQGELVGIGMNGEMPQELWEKYYPLYVEFMEKAEFVAVLWEYKMK